MSISRRDFLRASVIGGGSSALLGSFGRLLSSPAFASGTTTGYKALVCVFLYGGNDSNNTVIPTTQNGNPAVGYANYAAVRSSASCDFYLPLSALSGTEITPATIGGASNATAKKTYALNPCLPQTANLIAKGAGALVCNVGPLVGPTTSPSAGPITSGSYALPTNLYSHLDQQHAWQSIADPDPAAAQAWGWGGVLGQFVAEAIGTPQPAFPVVLSTDLPALFTMGSPAYPAPVLPFVTSAGAIAQLPANPVSSYIGQIADGGGGGNALMTSATSILNGALASSSALQTLATAGAASLTALGAPSFTPPATWTNGGKSFPTTGTILAQLQLVAQIIAGRQQAAMENGVNFPVREIFFVGFGLFDTHASQAVEQGGLLNGTTSELVPTDTAYALLTQLDQALYTFYENMSALKLGSQVTTFTMSDFNRTWLPASNTGTDHAWGGHHFVIGDAVAGNAIYGTDPDVLLYGFAEGQGTPSGAGPNVYDASAVNGWGGEGRWFPQVSVDQYGATLANWLTEDLSDNQAALAGAFPNLASYRGAAWPTNLGFFKAGS